MCGRIRQAGDGEQYMESLHWHPREMFAQTYQPRHNVAPGSRPLVLHRLGDGSEQADTLFWGYKPPWYKKPALGNANLTTILKGSGMWKSILTSRLIVPCDGWYEWLRHEVAYKIVRRSPWPNLPSHRQYPRRYGSLGNELSKSPLTMYPPSKDGRRSREKTARLQVPMWVGARVGGMVSICEPH